MELIKKIEEHYLMNWSEYSECVFNKEPINELLPMFKVLKFKPNENRNSWIYATCGMSGKDKGQGLELFILSPTENDFLIDLLENHTVDFVIIDVLPMGIKSEINVKELKKINNVFIYNKPLKIKDIKELENYKYILNYKDSTSTRELFNVLKKYDVEIFAEIQADITEMRVEEVKEGQGIGYVMEEAAEEAIKNKQVYKVDVPIDLPVIKINLIYNDKYLTKMDKIFIKKYLS